MSRDAALLDRLFTLTRGDLENAEFPFPNFGGPGWSFSFLKIFRVSSFWKNEDGAARVPFEQGIEDFVVGLFSQRLRWAFLIDAEPSSIKVGFGAESSAALAALRASLRGALPDVRLSPAAFSRDVELSRFTYTVQIVGCPSQKIDTERGVTPDQVERLCRGLFGERWAYLVVATPVDPPETSARIVEVTQEVRTIHETLMAKGSGVDEHNRLARQYVELLETKLKRLQHGRIGGMWTINAYFLAHSAEVLGRGAALLSAAFSGEKSLPDPLRIRPCRHAANATIPQENLTSRETAVLAAIPREEYPGYEVVEHVRFGVETNQKSSGQRVSIGDVMDRGQPTGTRFEVPLEDLTKHGLIVGVTGSGKTNTCFGLLDQIWNSGQGVPFLVIESAKSEYRSLAADPRFKGLKIFTVGDETTSPFRLNPFEVPPGILIQTHIDYLKALFAAAFVLYPPMPYVLEQSLEEVYQDRGWDLTRNTNGRGMGTARAFPTLTDLYIKVGAVVDRMGYDDQITMNVRSGLQARVNQLRIGGGKGLMLDTRRSVPMDDLFGAPCILELKQIVSDDEKAFVMGLVLIRLYERYESGCLPPNAGLRHVTLIEEAHRLLRNVPTQQGSEVVANPKGHAIEVFANILSEIRAYGEGFLIAEQVPVKLTPDAIKNTSLKIVHRLLAEDDRRAVGETMGISAVQSRYLPSLAAGEAVAFAEGMRKPVLVAVPAAPAKASSTPMPDQTVRAAMSAYWQQRADLRLRFTGCSRCASSGKATQCDRTAEIFEEPNARQALAHLFGAMLHEHSLVVDAFAELGLSLQRFAGLSKGLSLYCILVGFFENEIEQRGAFYGWPYPEVEQAVELASSVGWTLAEGFGRTDPAGLTKQAAPELSAFRSLMIGLCRRSNGPFPACPSCRDQCQYRFETARLESERQMLRSDFRSFFSEDLDVDVLARFLWHESDACFTEEDGTNRKNAAFCLFAQQIARLGYPTHEQRDLAPHLYGALEKMERE